MKKLSHIVVFLVVTLLLSCCSHIKKANMAAWGSPYEENQEYLNIGQAVFNQQCSQCHGNSGKGNGADLPTNSPPPPNFTDGSYSKSLGLVAANIKYGKREFMPAFKGKLTDKEIWSVAMYVRALP